MRRHALLLLLGASFALGGDATPRSPQIVRLKDGTALAGRVNSEDGAAEVVVNTFNSRQRAMTAGVERLPAAKVTKVETPKNPWAEYAERARKAGKGTTEEHLAFAKLLKDAGFKGPALEECVRAHLANPDDPGPAKAAGEAEWKKVLRADPRLNAELKTALEEYFANPSFAARKKSQEKLAKDYGYPRSFLYLERALRSKQQKMGRQDDRVLTLRSKANKGVYTLFIPSKYDPLVPTPMVLALHGGGNGGKDGKDVVGSGAMAMNFYSGLAERRGMIVACPTAVAAPWAAPANEPFLLACLEEVMCLYNIDENRVYLTGHSMGGFGTWSFGPKHNELFAVIAPMSGGGSNSFQKLEEMGTGVYLYHGADDTVVRFGDTRRAAETFRKDGADFIYAEIPNSGHSLPSDVLDECFDFFEAHRLHATPDRGTKGKFEITKEALSSFDRKVSADEKEYLEDPLKAPSANETIPALMADLRKGGGGAEAACAKIAELGDVAAVKPLAALLLDPKEIADARIYAARALGKLHSADALPALVKAIATDDVALWSACAAAIGEVGEKKGAPALRDGLKRAAALLKSKTTGANTVDYVDWERICQLCGVHVVALKELGDPAAAPDIAIFPAEGLLLAEFQIDSSSRAGQVPEKPRKKLAAQTIAALDALANPACAAVLEKLKLKFP